MGKWYVLTMEDHFVKDYTRGNADDGSLQAILNHEGLTLTIAGMYLGENVTGRYHIFAQEVDEGFEDDQFETFYVLKGSVIKRSKGVTV